MNTPLKKKLTSQPKIDRTTKLKEDIILEPTDDATLEIRGWYNT